MLCRVMQQVRVKHSTLQLLHWNVFPKVRIEPQLLSNFDSKYRFYRRVKHSTLQLLHWNVLLPVPYGCACVCMVSALYHKTLGLIYNFMGL